MSKNNNKKSNATSTVVDNKEPETVTPGSGETNIDGKDIEEVKEQETTTDVVSDVADTTPVSEPEPVVNEEPVKEEAVEVTTEEKEDEPTIIDGGFFLLIDINPIAIRLRIIAERLAKIGLKAVQLDDEIVVGPYKEEKDAIADRKRVLSKGLKCSVVTR